MRLIKIHFKIKDKMKKINLNLIKNILANFFLFASYAVIIPYLQVFFKNKGFSYSQIGILLGTNQIGGAIGIFLISRIAKKFGMFKILLNLMALTASIAFFLLYNSNSFIISILFCFIFGFSFWCFETLTDTILSFGLSDYKKRIWNNKECLGVVVL